jgi:hypothetical protein
MGSSAFPPSGPRLLAVMRDEEMLAGIGDFLEGFN